MSDTIQAVTYKKECILPNNKCKVDESNAALLDYVATVYGDSSTSKYDGKLTPEERKSVVELTGSSAGNQLSAARNAFFGKPANYDPRFCDNDKITQSSGKSEKFGEGYFIGSGISCARSFATEFDANLYAKVAANPEKWVFFVGNWDKNVEQNPFDYSAEVVFFNKLTKKFGIPINTTVIGHSHPKVLLRLKEIYNHSTIDVAVTDVVSLFIDMTKIEERSQRGSSAEIRLGKSVSLVLNDYYKAGVSINYNELYDATFSVLAAPGNLSPQEYKQRLEDILRERRENIKKVTDEVILENLKDVLAKSGKSKALFISIPVFLRIFKEIF